MTALIVEDNALMWRLLKALIGGVDDAIVECDSGDAAAITETVTAGTSSLSYDAATQTYTYVWKTEKNWANSCRRLTLTFHRGRPRDPDGGVQLHQVRR